MIGFTSATNILMVEDDDGHARLIEKAIRRAGLTNCILHLRTGNDCLDFLFGGQDKPVFDRLNPLLILLDLNLPDIAGVDVLRRIKADRQRRRLPVIVLTTTDDKLEVERCYDLGCNIYITKPVLYQKLSGTIRQLSGLLSAIELPEPV